MTERQTQRSRSTDRRWVLRQMGRYRTTWHRRGRIGHSNPVAVKAWHHAATGKYSMIVYDYTTPEYKSYTVTCPQCKKPAIISRVDQLNKTIFIHVWQHNEDADTWELQQYCLEKDARNEAISGSAWTLRST